VTADPILRAQNEAGDTYDDPSEDLLFEPLAELAVVLVFGAFYFRFLHHA
jgi:hypothetical protein